MCFYWISGLKTFYCHSSLTYVGRIILAHKWRLAGIADKNYSRVDNRCEPILYFAFYRMKVAIKEKNLLVLTKKAGTVITDKCISPVIVTYYEMIAVFVVPYPKKNLPKYVC